VAEAVAIREERRLVECSPVCIEEACLELRDIWKARLQRLSLKWCPKKF